VELYSREISERESGGGSVGGEMDEMKFHFSFQPVSSHIKKKKNSSHVSLLCECCET